MTATKMLYTFRASRKCPSKRYGTFINAMSCACYEGGFDEEIRDMLNQFERSDDCRVTTTCKIKADLFLTFMSKIDGWDEPKRKTGVRNKNNHPMVWKIEPIGGPDPRGR